MSPPIDGADRARTAKERSLADCHDACARRSTARGLAHFLAVSIGCLAAFLGVATGPGWGLKLLGSCVIFFFIFRLALIGHDAGHGSLTKNRVLNRWIGRLAFLPSVVAFSAWVASHNALHHAFTNVRGKDAMWTPLSKQEYDALSPIRRALERCYRTLPGVVLYNFVLGFTTVLFPGPTVLAHIPSRSALACERLAALGFLLVQFGSVLVWQRFLEQIWGFPGEPSAAICAAIVLPTLLMNWWTGLLSFLHHTHPRVRWYADLDQWRQARTRIECSVHLVAPWPIDWLLGNALEHAAHHAAPKLPDCELSAFQDQLDAAFPESIQRVNLTDCVRILALCKLYDYENHRWLDFDGKPTGEGSY